MFRLKMEYRIAHSSAAFIEIMIDAIKSRWALRFTYIFYHIKVRGAFAVCVKLVEKLEILWSKNNWGNCKL